MRELLDGYLQILKGFEGLRLVAYKPKGEKESTMYTIGYGHYGVVSGTTITLEEADELLISDLEAVSSQLVSLLPASVLSSLSVARWTALVDFVFNCGIGNFRRSILFRLILEDVNNPRILEEFKKWNKSGGVVLSGLTKRRLYESQLWSRG